MICHSFLLRLMLSVFLAGLLSCTRKPKEENFKPAGQALDHHFASDRADDLYRVQDVLKKWNPNGKPSGEPASSDTAPVFLQGTTGGLYSKGVFKATISNRDLLLKVRTASKGEKVKVSFVQENIHIDSEISFINEYEILKYTILPQKTEWQKLLAKLLGQVKRFKGFPDTEYYILPQTEGNFLILYKVAASDKIPYDERPIAKSVGDMLATPLVGYPIEYCVAHVLTDENKRETGRYIPKCDGVAPEQAEYIRFSQSRKKVFAYEPKPDLFPRGFFAGQWFYVRTIVRSPESRVVGHKFFQPASLVEFHPSVDKWEVLDASGYNLRKEDKIRALFIPVEWTDYEIKRDSKNLDFSFSERIRDDLHNTDLRYFKVRFDKLVENEIEFSGERTLKGVYITDDYISFNIEITAKGTGAYLLKYAFRKMPEKADYRQKQWFESDSAEFFPAFREKRRYYQGSEDHTQEDNDRFLRTTRFDPQSGEIRWHFSRQTPQTKWVRDLGRKAVQLLNRAFKEAGKYSDRKIKVVLDEREDQEVGDIRYNVLNLIVTEGKSNSGLFGLGPNVANPITGEVISATANVWVSNILESYIDIIRRYVRFHVYPPSWNIRPGLSGVTSFLHERIQQSCPLVSAFIEKHQNNSQFHPDNPPLKDKEAVKACAKTLAQPKILSTTLHEMLHGFAQRHIFSASADEKNFYKSYGEIQQIFGEDIFMDSTPSHPHPPQFSSLMDYFNLEHPVLSVPGKLDIAALRFIYFNQVELKDGSVLPVPSGADQDPGNPQKSILEVAKSKGFFKEDIKAYKICGGRKGEGLKDPHGELNQNDPLCRPEDYGKNPLEVVQNSILKSNNDLMTKYHRYDSESAPPKLPITILENTAPLYLKWKVYRNHLLRENGTLFKYFFLNERDIADYKALVAQKAEEDSEFKAYSEIARPLFDYFMELLFLPLKHCVYKGPGDEYHAVALEDIEEKILSTYYYPEDPKAVLIDCKSPVVAKWANDNNKGTFITEVGVFGKDRRYLLRPRFHEPSDEISVIPSLWSIIRPDDPKSLEYQQAYDGSPLLDMTGDPEFASLYYQAMGDYVLKGMDLNPYIDFSKHSEISRDGEGLPVLPRFLSYKMDVSLKVFIKRLWLMEFNTVGFRRNSKNRELITRMYLMYGKTSLSLVKMSEAAADTEQNPNYYANNYPFFTQLYREYEKDPRAGGQFSDFIKDHPASLYQGMGHAITLPVLADEPSFIASLYRRVNEFSQCIDAQDRGERDCPGVLQKRAFRKAIYDYENDIYIKKPKEKSQ